MTTRADQLVQIERQANEALIQYWCEVAAMKATEVSLLFGHGKIDDARRLLHETVKIALHIKELEDVR